MTYAPHYPIYVPAPHTTKPALQITAAERLRYAVQIAAGLATRGYTGECIQETAFEIVDALLAEANSTSDTSEKP